MRNREQDTQELEDLDDAAISPMPTPEDSEIINEKATRLWILEVWDEIREPFILLFTHALFILVGIVFLVLVGIGIHLAPLSPLVKEISHTIDEYLIVFTFVVLGISFIIKIATLILREKK